MSDNEIQSPVNSFVQKATGVQPLLGAAPTTNTETTSETAAMTELISNLGLSGTKPTEPPKSNFDWANRVEAAPQTQVLNLPDDMDEQTQALIRALSAPDQTKVPEAEEYKGKQSDVQSLPIPKLDANAIIAKLDFTKIHDAKSFQESLTAAYQAAPINIKMNDDVIEDLAGKDLSYLPGMISAYSNKAAQQATSQAIEAILGYLPAILTQFGTGMASNVETASFEAQVDAAFTNDVERTIAGAYLPKFRAAYPNASPADSIEAITALIKNSQQPATPPPASTEKPQANPWFNL